MSIQLDPNALAQIKQSASGKKKEEMAMAFEKLFARQLVQEMTKGLFEGDDKKPLVGAGNGLYREHVVDTLAQELAKQRKLGMADQISKYMEQKISDNSEG